MKVGILGTGTVGRAHAIKLLSLGYQVKIGTNDVVKTLANDKADYFGNPPFSEWHKTNSKVELVTFHQSVQNADLVINALKGEVSVEILSSLGKELDGKILIDVANPLDFSQGMPPFLSISNTNSLGEEIQKALPNTKVVKTFNTMTASIQVNPQSVAAGDHHIFLCGNDQQAKIVVSELLKAYGWKHILDLGDISNARGTEMMLPIWLRIMGALQTPMFNFKVVK